MPVGLAQWGDVKDLAEAVAGRDPITGDLLQPWERWVSLGAALVPVVNGKALGKTDDAARGLAAARKAAGVGKYADDAMAGIGKGNPNHVKVNIGKQDKHIPGTNNYKQSIASGANRSILKENPQQLLDAFAGTGQKIGLSKERVDFGKIIGQYYDDATSTFVDTTRGIIHYDSKGGAHIVPSAPK